MDRCQIFTSVVITLVYSTLLAIFLIKGTREERSTNIGIGIIVFSSVAILYRLVKLFLMTRILAQEEAEAQTRARNSPMGQSAIAMAMSPLRGGNLTRSRLTLLMTDRDFTGEDYEILSQLDNDTQTLLPGRGGGGSMNVGGADMVSISRLPTYLYTPPVTKPTSQHQQQHKPSPSSSSSSSSTDKTCYDGGDIEMQATVLSKAYTSSSSSSSSSCASSSRKSVEDDHAYVGCAICLESYETGDEVKTLACFHSFHSQCVDSWLMQKALCPVCKTPAFG